MKKKSFWAKLAGLITLIGLALFTLTACSSTSSSSKSTTTIKIGYMASVNSVGLAAIAKEAGYFEKQGLKVKLVEFADGPSIITALKSGSIQFGEIGPGAHTQVTTGAADIVLFDGLSTSDKIIGNTS